MLASPPAAEQPCDSGTVPPQDAVVMMRGGGGGGGKGGLTRLEGMAGTLCRRLMRR